MQSPLFTEPFIYTPLVQVGGPENTGSGVPASTVHAPPGIPALTQEAKADCFAAATGVAGIGAAVLAIRFTQAWPVVTEVLLGEAARSWGSVVKHGDGWSRSRQCKSEDGAHRRPEEPRMKNSRLLVSSMVSAVLALGWAAGCGSTNLGARVTIGPAGGTLSLPSEGVRLDVPAGAFSAPVEVVLRASSDSAGVLVGLEPAQLTLEKPATLTVTLARSAHIASVTEVSASGERPLGVDARVETPSGSSAQLRVDRFMQIRLSTEVVADRGTAPGARREHEATTTVRTRTGASFATVAAATTGARTAVRATAVGARR